MSLHTFTLSTIAQWTLSQLSCGCWVARYETPKGYTSWAGFDSELELIAFLSGINDNLIDDNQTDHGNIIDSLTTSRLNMLLKDNTTNDLEDVRQQIMNDFDDRNREDMRDNVSDDED